MKVLSFLTLATLLSLASCSHHTKDCCAHKEKMSCTKDECKTKKDHKCDDGSCAKEEKKACCAGDSCHKKS